MKIAIISDIHDNLINLEKCLKWCKKNNIKEIICCGDVTNSETLEFLSNNFKNSIYLIRGNMEIYDESEVEKYSNIKYYGRFGSFELEGKKIGLCHEPFFVDEILEKNKCDMIFYGHTHKPWESEKNGTRLINPGTLSGTFQKATFAVLDSKSWKAELKIL
ncbi:MAG: metallophosphoesterase [Candidatus Falkowbacteria bacterium]